MSRKEKTGTRRMRHTQFFGLSERAREYLSNNAQIRTTKICPHCKIPIETGLIKEKYDSTWGMFEEEIPLYRYTLKNGKTVCEVVQATPWSSGPCIFLCLKDESGKQFCKWPQKEIDNC